MKTQLNLGEVSELQSATAFFNAFLKEWDAYRVISWQEGTAIQVHLDRFSKLILPLRQWSSLGKHQYSLPFFIGSEAVGFSQVLEHFKGFLQLHAGDLGLRIKSESQIDIYFQRVQKSRENIQLFLEKFFSSEGNDIQNYWENFISAEQSLLLGHPFHPSPKSRDEFSEEDIQLYSPEMKAKFSLDWILVSPEILIKKGLDSEWNDWIAEKDLGSQSFTDYPQYRPFPMHPWQLKVLNQDAQFLEYIQQGHIITEGSWKAGWKEKSISRLVWMPTSSLRTLYCENAPWMLKFSMSLRLTNSRRHLLEPEVVRGLQIAEVLRSPEGLEFQKECPQFQVLIEPGLMALRDKNGNLWTDTVVVCRKNVFQSPPNLSEKKSQSVLSVLTQSLIPGEETPIQRLAGSKEVAMDWFLDFLNVAIRPMVIAQARYGIYFGAHQQNLILELKNGFPSRAYFRDCQGTGYSEKGYQFYGNSNSPAFSEEYKSLCTLSRNILDLEMGNSLFVYYVFLNSVFGVIAALANKGRDSSGRDWPKEEDLIFALKDWLIHLKKELEIQASAHALFSRPDFSCIDMLLKSPTLKYKGNFFFGFENKNENATSDPLAIYRNIHNPIYQPCTLTQNRVHPVRPKPLGPNVFQNDKFSFRIIDPEGDLDQFYQWHHQTRIKKFWDLGRTKSELRNYLIEGLYDPHQIPLVIEKKMKNDVLPIGYLEVYWAAEDRLGAYYDFQPYDRGFHFLIGDESCLRGTDAESVIRSICDFLFQDEPRTHRIMAEPRSDNQAVLKYVEKIQGWKKIREFDFPHKRAALLECSRIEYFRGAQ